MDRTAQTVMNLVFLHGFLGSPQDFEDLLCMLGPRFCHQLVDVNACIGTSFSDTLFQLKGVTPPGSVGIGYSMGGRLLLLQALTYPSLFKKIILLSADPGTEDPLEIAEKKRVNQNWINDLEAKGLNLFLEKWYDQPLFASLKTHPIFKSLLQRRKSQDPYLIKHLLQSFSVAEQPSLWSALQKLSIPLLYLAGEYDAKCLNIGKRLSSLGDSIQVKVIPRAGHAIHIENPAGCAKEMLRFILHKQPVLACDR